MPMDISKEGSKRGKITTIRDCCSKIGSGNFCSECGTSAADLPKIYEDEKMISKTKYVKVGEYRAPKKGEYFISGANPTAYEAYNDHDNNDKFHIVVPAIVISFKQEIEDIIFQLLNKHTDKDRISGEEATSRLRKLGLTRSDLTSYLKVMRRKNDLLASEDDSVLENIGDLS